MSRTGKALNSLMLTVDVEVDSTPPRIPYFRQSDTTLRFRERSLHVLFTRNRNDYVRQAGPLICEFL